MSRALDVSEHDHEPQPGLPERLPSGERLLWQGAPDWRVLARRGFHLRKFALYFGAIVAWRALTALADGATPLAALASIVWTLPLVALALGFIALLAWLVGRTTLYTLTDKRVVMRVGIVLTVTFNLPLARIETARLSEHPGGAGDLALLLDAHDRIGYLHLWPHARPWHFKRTEPSLRALPQARAVAALLADALAASAGAKAAVAPEAASRPSANARPEAAHAGHGHAMPHAA